MTPQPYDPKPALDLIERIRGDLDRLQGLVQPQKPDFDPMDPRNKLRDGKLTRRGVEICYRLFDRGSNRYAVAEAMGISFGAATHRLQAWTDAGGQERAKMPLLDDFSVVDQNFEDEVIIQFFDGPTRRLAYIRRSTLDDFFDPLLQYGPPNRRLSPQVWREVVEENVAAFERIITAKYERTKSRDGRLEIDVSDIRASGENFVRNSLKAAGIAAR
jgi:hypothetical protein